MFDIKPRRVAGLEVDGEALSYFCKGKGNKFLIQYSPIPKDAKFIGVEKGAHNFCLVFIFEHPEFDEVPPGNHFPIYSGSQVKIKAYPPKKKDA